MGFGAAGDQVAAIQIPVCPSPRHLLDQGWARRGGCVLNNARGGRWPFSSSSATPGYRVLRYPRRPNPNLCQIIGQKQSEARIPQPVFASHPQSQSILTAGAHIADPRRRGARPKMGGQCELGEIRRPPAASALAGPRLLVAAPGRGDRPSWAGPYACLFSFKGSRRSSSLLMGGLDRWVMRFGSSLCCLVRSSFLFLD